MTEELARKKFSGWMGDPAAEDAITKQGSIDAAWIGYWEGWKAALAAAPTPPAHEDEPVAWIILDWSGDRRGFETRPDAVEKLKESGCELIPLYTRPENSELRKAVAEYLAWYPEGYENVNINLKALRAALEGK